MKKLFINNILQLLLLVSCSARGVGSCSCRCPGFSFQPPSRVHPAAETPAPQVMGAPAQVAMGGNALRVAGNEDAPEVLEVVREGVQSLAKRITSIFSRATAPASANSDRWPNIPLQIIPCHKILERVKNTTRQNAKGKINKAPISATIAEFLGTSGTSFKTNIPWSERANPKAMEALCKKLFVDRKLPFYADVAGPRLRQHNGWSGFDRLDYTNVVPCSRWPALPLFFVHLGSNVLLMENNLSREWAYEQLEEFLQSDHPEASEWRGQENKILVYVDEEDGKTYLMRAVHYDRNTGLFAMSPSAAGPDAMIIVERIR